MNEAVPARVVTTLTMGHLAPRCLHVIAEYAVADALGDSPESAATLAAKTGLNGDALGRMMRLLATHGVFTHTAAGFGHTPASRLLRSDHPRSLRAYARMIGMPVLWNDVGDLARTARTGRPALDSAGLFAYFATHPEEAALFNEAMAGKASLVVPAVAEGYDFSRFERIADIGGGSGQLIRGILFELPHVIAQVADSPRLERVGGDFFTDALPEADLYVLMEVLHDWADAEAIAILAAVRRAAPRHARVLIVETLVSESPGPQWGKTLDVMMLAGTGGRERTPGEYTALLDRAELSLVQVLTTQTAYSIVEAVPA